VQVLQGLSAFHEDGVEPPVEAVELIVNVAELVPTLVQVLPTRCCHWYVSGAVPEARTLKLADCPVATVWFAGGAVMPGATGARDVAVSTSTQSLCAVRLGRG